MKKIVGKEKSISLSPNGYNFCQRPTIKFRWRFVEREAKEALLPALFFHFFWRKSEI